MMLGLLLFVGVSYALLILSLNYGFTKLPIQKKQVTETKTVFSVIIPFRNEAQKLPKLLQSIKELHYPKDKVSFWLVNDESEDDSVKIIEKFCRENPTWKLQILQNKRVSHSPKKDAISTAISKIKSDWIVTTDADCMLPTFWLAAFHQKIAAENPKMIAAPVTYTTTISFFSYFQLLDFLSLQGTTIGSFGAGFPFMCNGANLAYQKAAFLEVQGFSGNDNIASGDDVFLLEKFIQKWPKKVVYLKSKNAIVNTFPVASWKAFVSQRVRWASKSANYNLRTGKFVGIIVLLMNLLCCLLPFLVFTAISWRFLFAVFMFKIVLDSVFLLQTLQFTQQKIKPVYMLMSACIYPYMTIFIFCKSLFSTYTWKNRTFKK
ncbi:beta-monoglucosyldiacylglycerol synthase [Kordia sp. SMS9]|uniref:glycosyltransferase family 2 protein n=1 Tax=Kordia sp. SMS9 TaxID=2282170 RepID=UPI000E0D5179|nr:glycosyltransferase [Kordia sp. SMS9]AXG69652.1 beta-monoglucosyldiacylglycerol synthase [Kordia sp. SMS9]